LVKRTALAEGVHGMTARPVLHGDNGATLKASTMLAMLQWLGIAPSYSRLRVSGGKVIGTNACARTRARSSRHALTNQCKLVVRSVIAAPTQALEQPLR
jgi:hypothetical protein